ncbi:MAG: 3-oxo-5a-steroid 4- dehydrogenase [Cyphobasidiales sp. Tagirdzhanova-0007]|nr:MAG: 3-oxo-5a-steroid 4- dehydrogenase [Cyphobasidiales sp. Tagirdzhanova-0007]
MNSLTFTVTGRGGKKPISVSLPPSASTEELYKQVAAKTRLSVHRLRITTQDKKRKVDNDAKQTLVQAGVRSGDNLAWKDLGLQIAYRTTYLIEYGGPLIIHPLIYFYGYKLVYQFLPASFGASYPVKHSKMQLLAFAMVMAHYLKREIESLYVHRFSNAKMPFSYMIRK